MIRHEYIDNDFVRTYSDIGMYIHGGSPEADYPEALDPISANRTYIETDIPIQGWEEPEIMTVDENIPSGQYFSAGRHLYYSTESIAAGEVIVVGKNCIEANIADILNELKEE